MSEIKFYHYSNPNLGERYFKVKGKSKPVLQVVSSIQKKKGRANCIGVNLITYVSFIGSWGWKMDESRFLKEIEKEKFEKEFNKTIKNITAGKSASKISKSAIEQSVINTERKQTISKSAIEQSAINVYEKFIKPKLSDGGVMSKKAKIIMGWGVISLYCKNKKEQEQLTIKNKNNKKCQNSTKHK